MENKNEKIWLLSEIMKKYRLKENHKVFFKV